MAADIPAQGQIDPSSGASQFNAMAFLVKQMISRVNVATLVEVVAVSNAGGVAPIGTVDVLPLVNQVDGAGRPVPHVTVYGLPYMRVQGGANAIILDPQVGDVGVAVFCHSDTSSVRASSGKQSNPGSARRNSLADGVYCFSVISHAPQQYVQFVGNQINVHSPGSVNVTTDGDTTITAQGNVDVTSTGSTHIVATGGCTIDANTTNNGNVTVNGNISASGNITAGGTIGATGDITGGGKSLDTHIHSGVTIGGGNSGPPV